jgi:uncharacterized protein YfaS (alpha-2-macroglobulin family)
MSKKVALNLVLIALLFAALGGSVAAVRYYANLPEHLAPLETVLLGQSRFAPGSQAGLRILVRDSSSHAGLANAAVRIALRPQNGGPTVELYQGSTGADGALAASFSLPKDAAPEQVLVVETNASQGSSQLERPVNLTRDYRVLLTTDKPVYQPGQVIHLRALALSTFDLAPAAKQAIEVTIADGKGNKVFRQTLTTSEFGAAWTDFQLASEVNNGNYKISALLGSVNSEKTVTVEPYTLPKFKVELKTERNYYQPGQHVSGTLQADYFFGKPVAGAKVTLEGYTFDVQQNNLLKLELTSNEQGQATFEFDLPAFVAGSDLEGGLGRFYLQAAVIDQAQHLETGRLSLPVSSGGLVVQAIPEGGVFRARLDNTLYLMTSYPDGSPAETDLVVKFNERNQTQKVHTSAYGIAELHYTPDSPYQQFSVQARDARGSTAQRNFNYNSQWSEESVLLRPDKPVYQVGETMKLDLLTTLTQGTLYLDIVRSGQTLSTRSIPVADGKGQASIDLSSDLYGTLELHAYRLLESGTIVRDTRMVVVDPASNLNVKISLDQASYRPGDQAQMGIQVSGAGGQGVQAALGLAVVDEAVFALADSDPGFARLYFLLESQIMTPRYDLHGLSVPDLVKGLPQTDPALRTAVNQAAMASLSESSKAKTSFSLQANSYQETLQKATQAKNNFFTGFAKGLLACTLALAGGLALLVGFDLLRRKILGRSLLTAIGILSFLLVLMFAAAFSNNNELTRFLFTPVVEIINQGAPALAFLGLLTLACYLGLAGIAIARRDMNLGWMLILLLFFVAALSGLAFNDNNTNLDQSSVGWLIAAFLLVPFTLFMRFTGFLWEKRPLPALTALPLAFFMLLGMLPAANLIQPRGNGFDRGVVMDGAMQREVMPLAAPAPQAMAPVPTRAPQAMEKSATTNQASAAEPPRLRQYFPETMLWLPDAQTGADGRFDLKLPVADSITTWRVTALASSQDGRLGSVDAPLLAFQDFFIDPDLPVSLTVGDEVSIPVGIYNYLPEEQSVRLELAKNDWFELLSEPTQVLTIGPKDIQVAYFRIRARSFGLQPFQVSATGSKLSDAVRKEVRVYPAGKRIQTSVSDRLSGGAAVQQTVKIPASAVPGTQTLTVKVYPGVLSQVVEGLDSMLRMPSGCFEQTSSTTYPNILVLDYLRSTNQGAPETEMKAEEYINLGYQRLLTFEVQSSGGFSLFGMAPADRMLTAYGLQEFGDMSRVHSVDSAVLRRAADWLASQQASNGSWENDRGLVHENTWQSLGNDRLPVTAYITWSLVSAGFGKEKAAQSGLDYLREHQSEVKDAYVAALVANALVSNEPAGGSELSAATKSALERLVSMAKRDGQNVFWQSGVATFVGAEGANASIETTALAAYALLRANSSPDLVNGALGYLVSQKDSFGTWHSTQATVLALKALIQSVRAGAEKATAQVSVTLNDGTARTIAITPQNFDMVQQVSFEDLPLGRDAQVTIQASGSAALMYQVTSSYYLPWDRLAEAPQSEDGSEQVAIAVSYDRANLEVNDSVAVNVKVALNQSGAKAEQAMIDLGLPPGFTLESADLDALVERYKDQAKGYTGVKVERYELTGRQILIYLTNLSAGQPLEFTYHLRARFPLRIQTPASSAYDYYNPGRQGASAPQPLEVK